MILVLPQLLLWLNKTTKYNRRSPSPLVCITTNASANTTTMLVIMVCHKGHGHYHNGHCRKRHYYSLGDIIILSMDKIKFLLIGRVSPHNFGSKNFFAAYPCNQRSNGDVGGRYEIVLYSSSLPFHSCYGEKVLQTVPQ